MYIVPSKTIDVEASTQFQLAHSTKSGLHLYVWSLSRELADGIVIGSRDFEFLCGQADSQYLLVLIRAGKILEGEPKPYGDLESTDVLDLLNFYATQHPTPGTNA